MLETFTGGIYLVDFEFHPVNGVEGNHPEVVCMVVMDYRAKSVTRYTQSELYEMRSAPFDTGKGALFVAFYASAELDCFLQLGWPLPENLLDLYVEFRNKTNGLPLPHGSGQLGAMAYFGLLGIAPEEKEEMRNLILSGGPWSEEQWVQILDYCESDVQALNALLQKMCGEIDWPRALLRGRYMKAVSRIQHNGIPMDIERLLIARRSWVEIQAELVSKIDAAYGIYDGLTFKQERFREYLNSEQIPWPILDTGNLDLSEDTLRQMARSYPQIAPLHELRSSLSKLRLNALAVGEDGRNRCLLSPFRSTTGRNQPSNAKSIFGPSTWMRGFVKPGPGMAIAYIDWSQQEFAIAGALSGDDAMQEAYRSGDPYLAFAKQAGAVPSEATKQSHKAERERFKQCVLATQYGMGAASLAIRICQSEAHARQLLDLHRSTYRKFWKWSDATQDHYALGGKLWTVFGWRLHPVIDFNPRSVRNFPMQANGAEMLRLACIYLTEAGIRVCAPVHDAVLIEAPVGEIDAAVRQAQSLMRQASRCVLDGFELSSDAKIVRYPDRYMDERGQVMWDTVMKILAKLELEPLAGCQGYPWLVA
jgi:DNA polymerase-1